MKLQTRVPIHTQKTIGSGVNGQCDPGFCCIGENNPGPGASGGTCVNKGTIQSSVWLCDPGEWIKCDANSLGSEQTFDGQTFKCIKENDTYKWITGSAKQQEQEKATNLLDFFSQLFNTVLKFFGFS